MNEIDIKLEKNINVATAYLSDGYMGLDLCETKLESKIQEKSFIELVSRVINHETIHFLIYETENRSTSISYDKIAKELICYYGR